MIRLIEVGRSGLRSQLHKKEKSSRLYLELPANTNTFILKLPFVRVFDHSKRKIITKTETRSRDPERMVEQEARAGQVVWLRSWLGSTVVGEAWWKMAANVDSLFARSQSPATP